MDELLAAVGEANAALEGLDVAVLVYRLPMPAGIIEPDERPAGFAALLLDPLGRVLRVTRGSTPRRAARKICASLLSDPAQTCTKGVTQTYTDPAQT